MYYIIDSILYINNATVLKNSTSRDIRLWGPFRSNMSPQSSRLKNESEVYFLPASCCFLVSITLER
jgi:hypothetical protein